MRRIPCTMRFAERMTPGNKRDGLFIVHRHACKGFADIMRRGERIRSAIRAFWIHVDEAHLYSSQRIRQLALARIAAVWFVTGGKPLVF